MEAVFNRVPNVFFFCGVSLFKAISFEEVVVKYNVGKGCC
jgi:hypothetical protein